MQLACVAPLRLARHFRFDCQTAKNHPTKRHPTKRHPTKRHPAKRHPAKRRRPYCLRRRVRLSLFPFSPMRGWSAGRRQGLARPLTSLARARLNAPTAISPLPGIAASGCARPMTVAAAPPGAPPRCRCRTPRPAPPSNVLEMTPSDEQDAGIVRQLLRAGISAAGSKQRTDAARDSCGISLWPQCALLSGRECARIRNDRL